MFIIYEKNNDMILTLEHINNSSMSFYGLEWVKYIASSGLVIMKISSGLYL